MVPGIIRAEVLAALRSETEAERIAGMLAALDPAPEATTDDYEAAAAIYRRCRGSGRAVGSVVDCVVAQCCVRHGYALLTKDRDFRRIAAHTVMRVIEFSESSCVVTLFTEDFGKIGALAKGAKRPKSPFQGALDLLALVRIVFLRKSSDALDLLTEGKLERRFRSMTGFG